MKISTLILALFTALLFGCGGGGDTGGGNDQPVDTNISFSNDKITLNYVSTPTGTITVLVSAQAAPLIKDQFYPLVVDKAGVLASTKINATINAATGAFTAPITFKGSLAPGIYNGTLELILCKDPACANRYNIRGGILSYSLTVTATTFNFTKVTVNGVATQASRPSVKSGDVVSLQTDTPVTWTYGTVVNAGQTTTKVSNITTTPTTWTATITNTAATPDVIGSVIVFGKTIGDLPAEKNFAIDVTR